MNRGLEYGVFMKFVKCFMFLAFPLVFVGCTGYQLGSTLPEGVESVCIQIVNDTDEPSIEVEVMKSIRSEILMDGSLRLASEATADAILHIKLNHFSLVALAFDRARGELAEEYRMLIYASFILYDAAEDENANADEGDEEEEIVVILQSPSLRGEAEFPYASDLTTAKLGSLPIAADDLARQIISMVTSAW